MDKDKRRVIGAAILLPLIVIVSLNNIGVISLSDVFFELLGYPWLPIWTNDYFGVGEIGYCPSLPCDPIYHRFWVSPHDTEIRVYPFGVGLLLKCQNLSCVHKEGDNLLIYDNHTKLEFRNSPIFYAETELYCSDNVKDVLVVSANYTSSTVCRVYDETGELVYKGSPNSGFKFWWKYKYGLAIICDDVTLAFSLDPSWGVFVNIDTNKIRVSDLGCSPISVPYPIKAYIATMKGNHPELAYNVYCAAFGGCTPPPTTPPPELPSPPTTPPPELPSPNILSEFSWIGWVVLIVLILLLLVVIF